MEKRLPPQIQNPVVFITTSIPGPYASSPPQVGSGVSASFGDFSSGISTGGNLVASGNITLGNSNKSVSIASNSWSISDGGTATGFTALTVKNLTIGSGSDISGNAVFHNNVNVSGSLYASSTLQVTDTGIFYGNLGVGTTTPGAAFAVQGNILASGNLVTSGQTIGGNLSVTGNTTLGDALTDSLTLNASSVSYSNSSTSTIPNLAVNAFSIATSTSIVPTFSISTASSPFGMVGIGTTSPGATFSVAGNILGSGGLTVSGATTTAFAVTGIASTSQLVVSNSFVSNGGATSTFAGGLSLSGGNINLPTAGAYLINNSRILDSSTLGSSVATSSLTAVGLLTTLSVNGLTTFSNASGTQLTTTGSTYLATTGGNVGIGTTSPKATLGIAGSLGVNSTQLVLPAGGNVGIGLSSPGTRLTIEGAHSTTLAGEKGLSIWGDSSSWSIGDMVGINFRHFGSVGTSYSPDVSIGTIMTNNAGAELGDFFIATRPTTGVGDALLERMRITSGGNVGIGTTSPTSILSLGGTNPTISAGTSDGADNQGLFLAGGGSAGANRGAHIDIYGNENGGTGSIDILAGEGNAAGPNGGGTISFYTNQGSTYSNWPRLVISPDGTTVISTGASNTNTERFRITSGGNVGIGTTTPVAALNILNPAVDYTNTTYTNNYGFKITRAGTLGHLIMNVSSDALPSAVIQVGNPGGNPGNLILQPSHDTVGGRVGIGTTSPSAMFAITGGGTGTGRMVAFADSANTERFTILDNGNVGIGSTSPSSNLVINGADNNQLYLSRSSNPAHWLNIGQGGGDVTFKASGSSQFTFSNATNGAQLFLNGSGNVGIGTTSPAVKLDIAHSTGARGIRVEGTSAANTGIEFYNSGAGSRNYSWEGGVATAGDFGLRQSTAQGGDPTTVRLVVNSDGNVGIGTTSPTQLLSVSSSGGNSAYFAGNVGIGTNNPGTIIDALTSAQTSLRLQTTDTTNNAQVNFHIGTGDAIVRGINDGGASSAALTFFTSPTGLGATERMRITSSGNVGIGTTSPASLLSLYTASSVLGAGLRIQTPNTISLLFMDANSVRGGYISLNPNLVVNVDQGNQIVLAGGHVYPGADATQDLGQSTTLLRWRNVFASGCTGSQCTDIAEYYIATESMEAGDLVSIAATTTKGVSKASKDGTLPLLGIVSTTPGVSLAEGTGAVLGQQGVSIGTHQSNEVPVALTGRVPVKVSLENGPIKIGDRITSSSVAGVGMRATESGTTIGIALEPFDGSTIDDPGSSIGKILVFVNLGYSKLDSGISSATASSSLISLGWTLDQGTGRLKASYSLDMDGKDIVNARNILSTNGAWSINESGLVVVDSLETRKGVTTYDMATGQPFCIRVLNAQINALSGKCSDLPTNAGLSIPPPPPPSLPPESTTTPIIDTTASTSTATTTP